MLPGITGRKRGAAAVLRVQGGREHPPCTFDVLLCSPIFLHFYRTFSILAHASRKPTARLKTMEPPAESGSTQKYPKRSNWWRLPAFAPERLGSRRQSFTTVSESGFK